MTLKDLFDTLVDGETKLNIIDDQGIVLFRGIWWNTIDKSLLNKYIKRIIVEDYLLNVFVK